MPVRVIRELSRRRVFRGAGTYIVLAWLALRLVDLLTEAHDEARRLALYWAIGLFPLAVLFSWVFRVVPESVEQEQHGAAEPPRTPLGRALDFGVAAGVALVVVAEIVRRLI